jgi:hypothetical protein
MKQRAFHLHPGESSSAAIGRLHRYIRQIQPDYQPPPKAVSRTNLRRLERLQNPARPPLKLVKG